ncbi:polyketide cyclase/dehydrase/lipid transport protein [Nocardioides albertanoniae]|uniref:Polyketide cyclase/dehydrase/lipid transport protein n=1 Tax=Nocardioides albertanoniae TaxID=1175486 RepID=A0A543A9L6_9ACTN|nr:SRPBCC family protein [Nocardioides albertanoniae]TQL69271.1 polyketide cyclase/dehydrase/lipid transport protein [Nocardioides albertanoniae]
MADQTTSTIVIEATPSAVMAVIADFESYPTWAKGMQQVDVVEAGADGRAEQVRFVLDVSPIKDDYTLAYTWDGDRQVTWSLVKGNLLRSMDGAYVLRDLDGRTEVTYRLALDLSIPLIGMLKRKGEKVLIDTALRGLKQRVEK